MINYSDEEIFNIKNKRCLAYDPFIEYETKSKANSSSINRNIFEYKANLLKNSFKFEPSQIKIYYNIKKVKILYLLS